MISSTKSLIYSSLAILLVHPGNPLFAQDTAWSMRGCIDYALEKNIQLNQAQLTRKLNSINYDQARANLYPDLSMSDLQSFNFGFSTNTVNYQSSKQNIAVNNLSLNAAVTLFNGFLLRNTVRQSKYVYDASTFDLEKMKNDITLAVIADYLQVLYASKALEIAQSQVSNTTTQVDKTRKLVDAGTLAEGNLLQMQSQLATDKASLVNAENQLQIARVNLMQLMEIPIRDNFKIDSTGVQEPFIEAVMSSNDIYLISEGIMPEVKSAELGVKAQETAVRIAKSSLMPRLTFGGALKTGYSSGSYLYSAAPEVQTIGYLQSNPSELVVGQISISKKENYPFYNQFRENFGQVLSLNLTVPIFTNFQGKYGVERAKINLQNSQFQQQAIKDQLRKQIEQAYTDLTSAIKNYMAGKELLLSEERTYQDMERKYNLGMATATDFLIEKDNYEKARLTDVQARFTYIFKSKIVDFYLGKNLN
jgi:outer membrane protein